MLNKVLSRFDYRVDFMSKSRLAMTVSSVAMVVAIVAIIGFGLDYGLDFTGGTAVQVEYPQAVKLEPIREQLANNGFPDAIVQHFGTNAEVLIRLGVHTEMKNEEISSKILETLKVQDSMVQMQRVEFVGPQVGDELVEAGGWAVLFSLIGILIYVTLRFEYRFSLGAIAALVHDTLFVVGFFALLGLEFDLTVLAAVLAVIGYSLNDTIVVFDRVRDNLLKFRKKTVVEVMNISINQILGRTVMTSVTTLLVLVVLFSVGGELIHNFSTALIIGIVVGTYSSIYIAGATTLMLGVSRQDLLPVVKEGDSQLRDTP